MNCYYFLDINSRNIDEIIETVKLKLQHFKLEDKSKNVKKKEEKSENLDNPKTPVRDEL